MALFHWIITSECRQIKYLVVFPSLRVREYDEKDIELIHTFNFPLMGTLL